VARNVSLELWLEIGVKHMVFLELWLRITSLELSLGMADEHEELFSCLGLVSVVGVSVRVMARTTGLYRLPSLV